MSVLLGLLLQAAQAATPIPEPAVTPTPPTIDQLVELWFGERVLDAK